MQRQQLVMEAFRVLERSATAITRPAMSQVQCGKRRVNSDTTLPCQCRNPVQLTAVTRTQHLDSQLVESRVRRWRKFRPQHLQIPTRIQAPLDLHDGLLTLTISRFKLTQLWQQNCGLHFRQWIRVIAALRVESDSLMQPGI
jgi:hypothetical protein